jgi:hypothetical protein
LTPGSACLPSLWKESRKNVLMVYNFAGGGDGDQVFLMSPDPRAFSPFLNPAGSRHHAVGRLGPQGILARWDRRAGAVPVGDH